MSIVSWDGNTIVIPWEKVRQVIERGKVECSYHDPSPDTYVNFDQYFARLDRYHTLFSNRRKTGKDEKRDVNSDMPTHKEGLFLCSYGDNYKQAPVILLGGSETEFISLVKKMILQKSIVDRELEKGKISCDLNKIFE